MRWQTIHRDFFLTVFSPHDKIDAGSRVVRDKRITFTASVLATSRTSSHSSHIAPSDGIRA